MRSKIILMLVSTSFIYSAYAQCWNTIHTVTTDPNNPNNNTGNTFDWTADNTINWYYDFNQSHPVHLPYYCNGSQSTSINDGCSNENIGYYALIKNNNPGATQSELNKLYDILPSDGWELISYSFGIASAPNRMPHIILYNKFTGKLKIFVMAVANSGSSIGNTRAAVYVTWSANSTAKTALFAHAEPISPVMRYFNQSLDVVSPNSIVSLSGFGSVPDYQWLQAEMTAAYDPCTCQNILDGHGIPIIDISIQYFTSSDVSLFGTVEGEFSPASFPYYSGNGLASGITTDGSSSFWSALQNGYGSVMKGYKDWTDYANDLKDILTEQSGGGTGSGSSITTNNIFINSVATSIYTSNNLGPANQTQSYINSQVLSFLNSNSGNAVAEASGVNDLLTGTLTNIASALPYVGAFLGVVDFVSSLDKGKSNKPSPPTTFKVHEKISLSGTITGHSTLNNQTISVPGSNSTYGVGSQAPIYNNIMGVLNIGEIPSLMKKQITVTNHGVDPAVQNSGGTFFSNGSSVPWTIQDYKLSAPLKYMLNPAAGLTVHSIDAAFVFEYNYDDNLFLIPYFSSTNMNQKQVPYYPNGYSYRYYHATPEHFGGSSIIPLSQVVTNLGQAGIDLEYQSQGFVSTDVTQNAGGSIIRFRTKYVPLQCLHDLDFILMGGTNTPKMYIKLYCKFKRNDDPNADFVTAVYTFDAGNKLATATSVGSQNSGSMYFYDAAPTSNNADIHSVISHLYVYGAYGSPNYGNQPGNGTYNFGVPMASTGSITIPSNSMVYQYTPSYPNSINFLLSSMMDINAQDAVVVNGGNGEPDKLVQLTAYNDINFGDGPLINQASKLYAGNTINILHGGTIDATAYLPAVTDGIEFYAGNAINLGQGPPGFSSSLTIKGNVTFSASKSLPVYAVLHGCDDPDPISTYQESNSVISALCTAVGERVMAPSISEVSNSNNETIISFFPNPASNLLFFNIRTPYEGNVTVHITDVNGRIIREYQYTYVIGNNDFNLDLTGIGSGIYLVTASDSFDSVLKRDKICVIQ